MIRSINYNWLLAFVNMHSLRELAGASLSLLRCQSHQFARLTLSYIANNTEPLCVN